MGLLDLGKTAFQATDFNIARMKDHNLCQNQSIFGPPKSGPKVIEFKDN